MSIKHWNSIWAAWGIGSFVFFAIFEGIALATHRLDRTLSERLRAWLGIKPRKRWRYVGVALFLGFFAWFIPHIVWYAF